MNKHVFQHMTDKMQERLAPYFNRETLYYDVHAIASDFSPVDDNDPLGLNVTYRTYFSPDADHLGEEIPEVRAAKEWNAWIPEYKKTLPENQADTVVQEILSGKIMDSSVDRRTGQMSVEQVRILVQLLLAALERTKALSKLHSELRGKEDRPTFEQVEAASAINNRVLFALEYISVNGTRLGYATGGDDMYQTTGTNISAALQFAAGDNLETPELFSRDTEEYLASLGL